MKEEKIILTCCMWYHLTLWAGSALDLILLGILKYLTRGDLHVLNTQLSCLSPKYFYVITEHLGVQSGMFLLRNEFLSPACIPSSRPRVLPLVHALVFHLGLPGAGS